MKKKTSVVLIVLLVLMMVVTIGMAILFTQFHIESVKVVGNIHYTEEEIKALVLGEDSLDNSLLLDIKNQIKPIEDVPFIETIDIEFVSKNDITITVYEKAIAGCMEYMNYYVYFDKDGVVLDTSSKRLEDIPCVSGMKFDSVVLYEKLPIADQDRFDLILKLTQLISKYELLVDDMKFTSSEEVIIYYNDVKVLLGTGTNIEEKMMNLGNILKSLGDKKGTLDMRDFTAEKGNASFKEE